MATETVVLLIDRRCRRPRHHLPTVSRKSPAPSSRNRCNYQRGCLLHRHGQLTEALDGIPLEHNLERIGLWHSTGDAARLCQAVMPARLPRMAQAMQQNGMMTAWSWSQR